MWSLRTSEAAVVRPSTVKAMNRSGSPIRIRLSDEQRNRLIRGLQNYFAEQFDEDLSSFRAEGLQDFVLAEVAPAVYNQGVRDACAHLQEKLIDLEAEVHEPEPPSNR